MLVRANTEVHGARPDNSDRGKVFFSSRFPFFHFRLDLMCPPALLPFLLPSTTAWCLYRRCAWSDRLLARSFRVGTIAAACSAWLTSSIARSVAPIFGRGSGLSTRDSHQGGVDLSADAPSDAENCRHSLFWQIGSPRAQRQTSGIERAWNSANCVVSQTSYQLHIARLLYAWWPVCYPFDFCTRR